MPNERTPNNWTANLVEILSTPPYYIAAGLFILWQGCEHGAASAGRILLGLGLQELALQKVKREWPQNAVNRVSPSPAHTTLWTVGTCLLTELLMSKSSEGLMFFSLIAAKHILVMKSVKDQADTLRRNVPNQ